MPWTNRTGLAKATTVLATVLLVSVGLCGVNFVAMSGGIDLNGLSGLLIVSAYLEALAIVVSAAGLLIVGIITIVRALTK